MLDIKAKKVLPSSPPSREEGEPFSDQAVELCVFGPFAPQNHRGLKEMSWSHLSLLYNGKIKNGIMNILLG